MASRSEQCASQVPSALSVVTVTVKVAAAAGGCGPSTAQARANTGNKRRFRRRAIGGIGAFLPWPNGDESFKHRGGTRRRLVAGGGGVGPGRTPSHIDAQG